MKVCCTCKESKAFDLFHKNKATIDGFHARCKECRNAKRIEKQQKEAKPKREAKAKKEKIRKTPEEIKENTRRRRFVSKYGITYDQWLKMRDDQSGKCPLCLNETDQFHVDHDHSCCNGFRSCGNCIRALLCKKCNWALGLVNDDIETLQRMIGYLSHHARRTD